MKEQIQEILKGENISSSQFADKIGVQRSSVSHVISGRNKPGFEFIKKVIEAFPDINADWLITGNGEMYRQIRSSKDLFNVDRSMDENSKSGDVKERNDVTKPSKQVDPVSKTEDTPSIERIIVFKSDKTFREYLKES